MKRNNAKNWCQIYTTHQKSCQYPLINYLTQNLGAEAGNGTGDEKPTNGSDAHAAKDATIPEEK